MKKLLNYIPLHFLIGLTFGIILQTDFNIWSFNGLKLFILLVVLILAIFIINIFKKKILFTILSFILFVFIGISTVFIHTQSNYKNHYLKLINKNSFTTLKINEILKPNIYNNKYKASVISVDDKKSIGYVLVNIKKDNYDTILKVGQQILLKPEFLDIPEPKNPYQFNYKNYLIKQGIHQQIFTNKNELKLIGNNNFSLYDLAYSVRYNIQSSLKKYNFSDDEYSVINALLLGQKQEISTEIKNDYANAGAIHILAISGLHIGILMMLLSYIFKPINNLKRGKIIKTLLIVTLLWVFAFVTGLSASVVRAVTMFTFIAIGQSLQKENSIEHSLISSMFLLLLIKPMFLYDIGFQLSYLCVFGIVWLQPLFLKLWTPKFNFTYKLWQLITISLSVQISTLPISLYYFNQFPGLFLLSNLIIIPCLSAILIGGIIVIILSLLNILPEFLANFYGFIISLLNNFVKWISKQEQFLFTEISMSLPEMLSWYFFIFSGIFFIIKRKPNRLIYFLISVLMVQSVIIFEKHQRNLKEEFIIFQKNKNTIIGKRQGINTTIYSDIDRTNITKLNILTTYKIKEHISLNFNRKTPNILKFKNNTILVIDSLGVYKLPILKNSIVLLTQSPKINLDRLILTLQPKKIIADGNNYKRYINLWKKSCKKQKTPFYSTEQNGAYIFLE